MIDRYLPEHWPKMPSPPTVRVRRHGNILPSATEAGINDCVNGKLDYDKEIALNVQDLPWVDDPPEDWDKIYGYKEVERCCTHWW